MENNTSLKLSNRRRSIRAKARTTVKVQCRKGALGLGPNLAHCVLDLSDSGVRLIIKQPLELMSEVEIIIDGYGMKDSIKRLGNVRWLINAEGGQYCVGIEFQKSLSYRDWLNMASPN